MKGNTLAFYLDIAIIVAIIVFLMGGFFAAFYEIPSWHALNVALAVAGSLPTLFAALRALSKFTVTGDLLGSVALTAALFFTSDIRSVQYIILMLSFARLADYFAQARAKKATGASSERAPKSARLIEGETEKQVPPETVKAGDVVLVRAGERIPVDGVVEKGDGLVNESSLSGELSQIFKRPKDRVYASAINESGLLYVRTQKAGNDTMFAKITGLVESAQASKTPIQKIAGAFAVGFLPAALLVAGMALYFTGDIAKSIALLLVVSADAVAVAAPLAVMAGIAKAARAGVIIKSAAHFGDLPRVSAVMLGKAGTLMYRRQDISFIRTFWGTTEDALVSFAATAEEGSEHPLARTILEYARKRNIPYAPPDSFEIVQGEGVKAKHKGKMIFIGNERFISGNNIHIQDEVHKHVEQESSQGATPLIVAYDMRIIGVLSVTDAPRVSAKEAVRKLRELGIAKIVMMTEEHEEAARRISDFLGIDAWYAQAPPEDRLKKVKALADAGEKVLMVGDGVADAPALTLAHVGIVTGAHNAESMEAADIALFGDNFERIPETIRLSRSVTGAIRANIWLWIGSNGIGVALVFTGVLGPVGAALFHFLTGLIPLGASLRLFRKDK